MSLLEHAIKLFLFFLFFLVSAQKPCNPKNAQEYIGEISKIKNLTNNSCNRDLINDIADYYQKEGNYDKLISYSEVLQAYSLKSDDSLNIAHAYFFKANAYSGKFTVDSSFYYYDKSQKLFNNLGFDKYVIKSIRRKAYLYSLISDYNKSLELNFKALKSAKQINDFDIIYQSHLSILISYNLLGKPKIAREHHDKALLVIKKHKDELGEFFYIYKSQIHNYLGATYLNSNNFLLAKKYYLKAKNVPDIQTIYPELHAAIIGNIAYARFKSGEKEQVKRQLKRSLQLKDSLGNQALTAVTKRHLAECYHKEGDQAKSLSYIKAAYKTAEKYQLTDEVLDALRLMAALIKRIMKNI